MDEFGEFGYFLLNVLLLAIMSTHYWGINALIIFGNVMASLGLVVVFSLFFEAGTGLSPAHYIITKTYRLKQKLTQRLL